MKKYLFLLAIILISGSCKEHETEDPVVFSGITVRNEFGDILSSDSTDWQLFDQWVSKEKVLFENNINAFCDTSVGSFSVGVYPNPCTDLVIINFTRPEDYRISVRLVDQEFNVLLSEDTTISTSWMINPGLLNFEGDLIRLYYKISSEGCELRGHGDIQVIKEGFQPRGFQP